MRMTSVAIALSACFGIAPALASPAIVALPAEPEPVPETTLWPEAVGEGVLVADALRADVDAGRPAGADDRDEDDVVALRDRVETLAAELEALREQVESFATGLAQARAAMQSHRLPASIAYAGHAVPLDRWDVTERLEREFYLSLGSPAQVILWLKRSARYFPYIEAELERAGLPDDLKYVAVVESALLPRALSWARASGIWQFMAATATAYNLRVTPAWDERRDPARSTAAALAFLRDLHASFKDWPLALAAYNAGEGRVRGAMRRQGVSTYYQLSLPLETERYFFRILAAKLILEDPARYGFEVPLETRYSPPATEAVTLRVVGHVTVAEIAEAAGSFYRQVKALNPAIMADSLPGGRYELRIPAGQRATFEAARPDVERRMAARAVQRVQYRVRPGDTLGGIARRHGVSLSDLRRWNPAVRSHHIRPGQTIAIERRGVTP
jgi:membrane-bound lytic murein transglycosylase D